MSPAEILEAMTTRGIPVYVVGNRLQVVGSQGAYRDLLPELVTHKQSIIAALTRRDPRPDLTDDSALWGQLLQATEDLDGHNDPNGLNGAFLGLRSLGAVLVRDDRGLRLAASQDYWTDQAAWKADADKWLKPHLKPLRALLAQLDNNDPEARA